MTPSPDNKRYWPYVFALMATIVAALIRWLLDPLTGNLAHYTLFYFSVTATVMVGGLRPGLFATALGGILGVVLFVFKMDRFDPGIAGQGIHLALYVATGIAISTLGHWGRRQRRQFQEAAARLMDGEAQLRTVIENLAEGLVVVDPSGTVVQWNKAALAMHDYDQPSDELVIFEKLAACFELRTLKGEVVPVEQWPIPRLIRGEPLHDYELIVRSKTRGWERIFSYGGTLVRDAQGKPHMGLLTIRDIGSRKRAEEELERSRTMMSEAEKLSHTGAWEWDVSRDELVFSDEWLAVHGCSDRRLSPAKLLEIAHPDDRPAIIRAFENLRSGIACYNLEHRIFRQDTHEERVVRARGSFVSDASGKVVRAYGFAQDITEQKRAELALRQSEEQFRGTFENAAVGIANVGPNGEWLAVNEKLCEVTGYTREEMLGMKFQSITHPEDLPANLKLFDQLLRRDIEAYTVEKRYLRKGGDIVWTDTSVASHWSQEGELLYVVAVVQDITARKQAEDALSERTTLLRAISDSSQDPIYVKDCDGRLRFANPATIALIGKPEHEVLGKTDAELLNDKEAARKVMENDRRVIESGITIDLEEFVPFSDGTRVIWSSKKTPYRDAQGNIIGLLGISRNITERKRVEEKLNLQAAALQAAADAIVITDRHGSIQWVNAAFEQLTGYSAAEACGQTPRFLKSGIQGKGFFQEMWITIKTGHVWRSELVNRRKDGSLYNEQMSITPVRQGEQITNFVAIKQDVTARRQAEERLKRSEALYRTIAASILNGLVTLIDRDLHFMVVEGNLLEKFNMDRLRMEGRAVSEALVPELRQSIEPRCRKALTGEKSKYETQHGDIWVLSQYVPIRDDHGKVIAVMMLALDITERKLAEQKLNSAKDELSRANIHLEHKVQQRTGKLQEAVGELQHFSYTITHDMRAPLRAMKGFAQLLLEEAHANLNEPEREYIGKIMASAERMDNLITDALNYNKLVRQEFTLTPVDVEGLLREMIETYPEFQPEFIDVEIQSPIPPVMANKAGLTQCFSNFINNAAKFCKAGEKPQLRIYAEVRGKCIRIWFQDRGIGINPDYANQVFEMFKQLHKGYPGTGIGLALVRKAAERMNGEVGVESEPGIGSRFWLEFATAAVPEKELVPSAWNQ